MPHKRTTPLIFHRAKALRRALTSAERKLWTALRGHRLEGWGFRRQHALGRFIVDFACNRQKLVIEVDGDTHANQTEYDAERTQWLEHHGWRVMRLSNREIETNIEGVILGILDALEEESGGPQDKRGRP